MTLKINNWFHFLKSLVKTIVNGSKLQHFSILDRLFLNSKDWNLIFNLLTILLVWVNKKDKRFLKWITILHIIALITFQQFLRHLGHHTGLIS